MTVADTVVVGIKKNFNKAMIVRVIVTLVMKILSLN